MLPTPKVIDVNVPLDALHLAALKKAGVQSVIGYLNPLGQNAKALTPARTRAIGLAGLRCGLVSEGWGDFAHNGISVNAGHRDALHALDMAPKLGATQETVIYFAVDTDATWGQIIALVIPYFSAIKRTAPNLRLGVYGSGAVCETLFQQQLVERTWLAAPMGWLRSREFNLSGKWNLKQLLPTKVAGVPCDPNLANDAEEWGDFVPNFEETPSV